MRILWMRWVTVAALTGGLSGCLMQVEDEGRWNDPDQSTEQSQVMSGDLPGGAEHLAGRLPHVMIVPEGLLSSDSKWGSTHGTSLEMGNKDADDDPRSPDPVPWRKDQVQDPSAGQGEQMNLDGEGQAPDPVPWREGHGAMHGSQSGASSTDGDGLAPDPVPWRQKSANGQGTQQQQAPQAQGEQGDGDEPSGDGIPSGPGHWIFVR